jgi:hypothetical protein
MAQCDAGYFCYACGEYVESITESELYLRYVMREVAYEDLPKLPDGHIRCNARIAQYVVDPSFPPVHEDEPLLDKRRLERAEVEREEARVTRAWRHLQRLPDSGLPVARYPLGEA